jgi:hypothetical protein
LLDLLKAYVPPLFFAWVQPFYFLNQWAIHSSQTQLSDLCNPALLQCFGYSGELTVQSFFNYLGLLSLTAWIRRSIYVLYHRKIIIFFCLATWCVYFCIEKLASCIWSSMWQNVWVLRMLRTCTLHPQHGAPPRLWSRCD